MLTSTTGPKTAPRLPREIWILGFVSLLMDVSSEMIHSILPLFLVTQLSASAFTVGIIDGLAEATALFVKVFSGAISDWYGRRKPLAVLGYGLGALSKPLFAFASSSGLVLFARILDRIGKGLRGAPRDALVADLAPPEMRGAAFGLRQSLDTTGAFLGPLLAVALLFWQEDAYRLIFAIAVIPGVCSVLLLKFGIPEPETGSRVKQAFPLQRSALRALPASYGKLLILAALFSLARFSEAFLLLEAKERALPLPWVPLALVGMNIVYALAAYPFGVLADRLNPRRLLSLGIVFLIVADLFLAFTDSFLGLTLGLVLWGLHMAMTQGLLSAMIARVAPAHLRGTAFGCFHFVTGLALLFASGLTGWIWDHWGSSTSFQVGALLASLSLICSLLPQNLDSE